MHWVRDFLGHTIMHVQFIEFGILFQKFQGHLMRIKHWVTRREPGCIPQRQVQYLETFALIDILEFVEEDNFARLQVIVFL